jgi:hypothetical protein
MDAYSHVVDAAIVWSVAYRALVRYNQLSDKFFDPETAKEYARLTADAQDLLLAAVDRIRC